jgi:hypothetical protein
MADDKRGMTYAQAGVDIDAGNRMVDLIKPLVRATARPGADAEIGGFGGLFDLKRAGYKDPILVAANDGVGAGPRGRPHQRLDQVHHPVAGIDIDARLRIGHAALVVCHRGPRRARPGSSTEKLAKLRPGPTAKTQFAQWLACRYTLL